MTADDKDENTLTSAEAFARIVGIDYGGVAYSGDRSPTPAAAAQLNKATLTQMVEWLRDHRIEFELTTNDWVTDQGTVDQVTSASPDRWVSESARAEAFAKGGWCRATVTLVQEQHFHLYGYDPEELLRGIVRHVMRERYGRNI